MIGYTQRRNGKIAALAIIILLCLAVLVSIAAPASGATAYAEGSVAYAEGSAVEAAETVPTGFESAVTYTVTNSGANFLVTSDGATAMNKTFTNSEDAISAIDTDRYKEHYGHQKAIIYFGDGTNAFNLGQQQEPVTISHENIWIKGKITAEYSTVKVALPESTVGDGYKFYTSADIISTADSNRCKSALHVADGNITILGGTIQSNYTAVFFENKHGYILNRVTVSGGNIISDYNEVTNTFDEEEVSSASPGVGAAILASKGDASGAGTLTVTGGNIIGKSVAIYVHGIQLDISGGNISVASDRADKTGGIGAVALCHADLNITGGSVTSSFGNAIGNALGRVTVSGTAEIHGYGTAIYNDTDAFVVNSSDRGRTSADISGGTIYSDTDNAIYAEKLRRETGSNAANIVGELTITGGNIYTAANDKYSIVSNDALTINAAEGLEISIGKRPDGSYGQFGIYSEGGVAAINKCSIYATKTAIAKLGDATVKTGTSYDPNTMSVGAGAMLTDAESHFKLSSKQVLTVVGFDSAHEGDIRVDLSVSAALEKLVGGVTAPQKWKILNHNLEFAINSETDDALDAKWVHFGNYRVRLSYDKETLVYTDYDPTGSNFIDKGGDKWRNIADFQTERNTYPDERLKITFGTEEAPLDFSKTKWGLDLTSARDGNGAIIPDGGKYEIYGFIVNNDTTAAPVKTIDIGNGIDVISYATITGQVKLTQGARFEVAGGSITANLDETAILVDFDWDETKASTIVVSDGAVNGKIEFGRSEVDIFFYMSGGSISARGSAVNGTDRGNVSNTHIEITGGRITSAKGWAIEAADSASEAMSVSISGGSEISGGIYANRAISLAIDGAVINGRCDFSEVSEVSIKNATIACGSEMALNALSIVSGTIDNCTITSKTTAVSATEGTVSVTNSTIGDDETKKAIFGDALTLTNTTVKGSVNCSTLNMDGGSVSAQGIGAYGYAVSSGDATIKNKAVIESGSGVAMMFSARGTVTITDSTLIGLAGAIVCDNGDGTMTITDSTLKSIGYSTADGAKNAVLYFANDQKLTLSITNTDITAEQTSEGQCDAIVMDNSVGDGSYYLNATITGGTIFGAAALKNMAANTVAVSDCTIDKIVNAASGNITFTRCTLNEEAENDGTLKFVNSTVNVAITNTANVIFEGGSIGNKVVNNGDTAAVTVSGGTRITVDIVNNGAGSVSISDSDISGGANIINNGLGTITLTNNTASGDGYVKMTNADSAGYGTVAIDGGQTLSVLLTGQYTKLKIKGDVAFPQRTDRADIRGIADMQGGIYDSGYTGYDIHYDTGRVISLQIDGARDNSIVVRGDTAITVYGRMWREFSGNWAVMKDTFGEFIIFKTAFRVEYSGGSVEDEFDGTLTPTGDAPADNNIYTSDQSVELMGAGAMSISNYRLLGWSYVAKDGKAYTAKVGDEIEIQSYFNSSPVVFTAVWEYVPTKYHNYIVDGMKVVDKDPDGLRTTVVYDGETKSLRPVIEAIDRLRVTSGAYGAAGAAYADCKITFGTTDARLSVSRGCEFKYGVYTISGVIDCSHNETTEVDSALKIAEGATVDFVDFTFAQVAKTNANDEYAAIRSDGTACFISGSISVLKNNLAISVDAGTFTLGDGDDEKRPVIDNSNVFISVAGTMTIREGKIQSFIENEGMLYIGDKGRDSIHFTLMGTHNAHIMTENAIVDVGRGGTEKLVLINPIDKAVGTILITAEDGTVYGYAEDRINDYWGLLCDHDSSEYFLGSSDGKDIREYKKLWVSYRNYSETGVSGSVRDTKVYHLGKTATLLGNNGGFIRSGYEWAGWRLRGDTSGKVYRAGDTVTFTANADYTEGVSVNFEPVWEKEYTPAYKYTVTDNENGGYNVVDTDDLGKTKIIGVDGQTLAEALSAIATHLAGNSTGTVTFTFGSADTALDLKGGTWTLDKANVTYLIYGKITSGSSEGTIAIANSANVAINAAVVCTAPSCAAISHKGTGTLSIGDGADVSSSGYAIINDGGGMVEIAGGRVVSDGNTAVYNKDGEVVLSGGTVSYTGTESNNYGISNASSDGIVRLISGTVSSANTYAVSIFYSVKLEGDVALTGGEGKAQFFVGAGKSLIVDESYSEIGNTYSLQFEAPVGRVVAVSGSADETKFTVTNANYELRADTAENCLTLLEVRDIYFDNYVIYKDGANYVIADKDPDGSDMTEIYRGDGLKNGAFILADTIDVDRYRAASGEAKRYYDCTITFGKSDETVDLGENIFALSNGKYTVKGSVTSKGAQTFTVSDAAVVVIDATEISNTRGQSDYDYDYAGCIVLLSDTARLSIVGGTLRAGKYSAVIYHQGEGDLTISQGTGHETRLEAKTYDTTDYGSEYILGAVHISGVSGGDYTNRKLTVTGGTIDNAGGVCIYRESTCSIEISGGTVKSENTTALCIYSGDGTVAISGGTFISINGDVIYTRKPITVSGGTITPNLSVRHAIRAESNDVTISGSPAINGNVHIYGGTHGMIIDAGYTGATITIALDLNYVIEGAVLVKGSTDREEWHLVSSLCSMGVDTVNGNLIMRVHVKATFDMGGVIEDTEQDVSVDTAPIRPTDPTAVGMTFVGWYTDSAFNTEYDFNAVIAANITVYAKWTMNDIDVSVSGDGTTIKDGDGNISATYNGYNHYLTPTIKGGNSEFAYTYAWAMSGDENFSGNQYPYKSAGTYELTLTVTATLGAFSNTTDITLTLAVAKMQLEKPVAQDGVVEFFYKAGGCTLSVTGDLKNLTVTNRTATEPGNYKATFAITDPVNYEWNDGKTDIVAIEWKIIAIALESLSIEEVNHFLVTTMDDIDVVRQKLIRVKGKNNDGSDYYVGGSTYITNFTLSFEEDKTAFAVGDNAVTVSYQGVSTTITVRALNPGSVVKDGATGGVVSYYIHLDDAISNADTDSTVQLLANHVRGSDYGLSWHIFINKKLTLDLNGYIIDRGLTVGGDYTGRVIVVGTTGNLTLLDSRPDISHIDRPSGFPLGGVITGGYTAYANGEYSKGGGIYSTGALTIQGGTIYGNTADNGGGVYQEETTNQDKGILTMTGGAISGNTATLNGGGVYYEGTTAFTMSDGTISDNIADIGGGVYVGGMNDYNSFVLQAGSISGNAAKYGSGVYTVKVPFKMSGGEICGNRLTTNSLYTGTVDCFNVILTDGKITDNIGAGVYIRWKMSVQGDAVIDGNKTADGAACDIYYYGYAVTLSGAYTGTLGIYVKNETEVGKTVVERTDGGDLSDYIGVECIVSQNPEYDIVIEGTVAKTVQGLPAPTVTPTYIGALYIDGSLYNLSLTLGAEDTPGTIAWKSGQTVVSGATDYQWTFTPADAASYRSVSGYVTITAVEIAGFEITIESDFDIFTSTAIDTLKSELTVKIRYTNGTFGRTLQGTDFTVSVAGGALVAGKNTLTITGDAREETFEVTAAAVSLESITALFDSGENVIYSSFTLDDLKQYLKVTGVNNDGSAYNDGAAIAGYSLSGALDAGKMTITVSYLTKTDTFDVVVTRSVLTDISVVYAPGDAVISTADTPEDLKQYLTVTANYNDGKNKAVGDYALSVDTLKSGTYDVTVTYLGHTATFQVVVVSDDLTSIAITQNPAKTAYLAFELFNSAGMVVTATFAVTGEKVISDYTVGSDELRFGDTAVTVSYSCGGITQQAGVEVTVAKIDWDLSGINFADKTAEYVGEKIDMAISGNLPTGRDGSTLAAKYSGNDNVNAGVYVVTATFASDSTNYNLPQPMEAKLTISPKAVDIDWGETTFTYDGTDQKSKISANYTDVSGACVALTISGGEFKDYNVDGYTFTASFASETKNYRLPSLVSKVGTINKKALTVTANNHTIGYGAAPDNNGVMYDGFAGEEDESVLGGTIEYAYEYTRYGDVGSYAITPSGLSAQNYEITYVNGALSVSPAAVTLTIDNVRVKQGAEEQPLTARVTAGTVFNGDTLQYVLSAAVADFDKLGKYAVTGTDSDKNYVITFVDGQYEIYSIADYLKIKEKYGDLITKSPDELTWQEVRDVSAMYSAYSILDTDNLGEFSETEKDAILALNSNATAVFSALNAAGSALSALDGVTAIGLRGGDFIEETVTSAIAAAKAAAKAFTDLSTGLKEADLAKYGNIAAAEQAIADFNAYRSFQTSYGETYAKDPAELIYAETVNTNEMYAAYLALRKGAKDVLTEAEAANIAALKAKADALTAEKEIADEALGALETAIADDAGKEKVQDLLSDAKDKTDDFFAENGTEADLPDYSAIEEAEEKISQYEKQEFEQQVEEELGGIGDYTPDVVGGMDIPNLEDTIGKVQDAIDKIDASSDKTKEGLAEKREELSEVKDALVQKLGLENTKAAAIEELETEKEKLLSLSQYSASAKKEIDEYYAKAVDNITLATDVSAIAGQKDACVEEMNSVEILHVGLLVANLIFALLFVGEIIFLVFRKKLRRKKKSAKTYSVALPLVLLAAAAGGGLATGVTFLVILVLAVVVLGVYIADKVWRDLRGKTVLSPVVDKVDAAAKKCVGFTRQLFGKKAAQESGVTDTAVVEDLSKTETDTAAVLLSEEEAQNAQAPHCVETDENDEEDAAVFGGIEANTGLAILIRYKKSFTAKLIRSSEETKHYYSDLKNALLSCRRVTSRISWGGDSIKLGRMKLAKFNVRGKTLQLYLALNPDDLAGSKYKVERSGSKKYEATPCLYKIKNDRRARYATELIAKLCEASGLTAGETQSVDYAAEYPYDTIEALIARGLIKELISKENYDAYLKRQSQREIDGKKREFVSAHEVSALLSDEVAAALVQEKSAPKGTAKSYKPEKRVRGIVNIDNISEAFGAGDTVTLSSLQGKGLLANGVNRYKVLARGTLDKSLTVEANDFSIEAVKMILLTGGSVVKLKDRPLD